MTNKKFHIVIARVLLACFVAGQFMVYAHRHTVTLRATGKTVLSAPAAAKNISEKCSLCDALHHSFFEPGVIFHTAFIAASFVQYKHLKYRFLNYSLTAAGGRAPPLAANC